MCICQQPPKSKVPQRVRARRPISRLWSSAWSALPLGWSDCRCCARARPRRRAPQRPLPSQTSPRHYNRCPSNQLTTWVSTVIKILYRYAYKAKILKSYRGLWPRFQVLLLELSIGFSNSRSAGRMLIFKRNNLDCCWSAHVTNYSSNDPVPNIRLRYLLVTDWHKCLVTKYLIWCWNLFNIKSSVLQISAQVLKLNIAAIFIYFIKFNTKEIYTQKTVLITFRSHTKKKTSKRYIFDIPRYIYKYTCACYKKVTNKVIEYESIFCFSQGNCWRLP